VCAPQAVGPQDTVEVDDSKGSSDGAAGGDRVPVSGAAVAIGAAAQVIVNGGSLTPEVLPEDDTNVTVDEMAAGGPAASTGLAGGVFSSTLAVDDATALEESEVILGHPTLRAPVDVSLDQAMGMSHRALTQAQNVLRRESGGSSMNSGTCCCGLPCSRSGQRQRGQGRSPGSSTLT
jgi:hypothetical protein